MSHFYIDGIEVNTEVTRINGTIKYTDTDYTVCAATGGAALTNADVEFMYVNTAETLDFSIEANRRLFFNADGSTAISPSGNGTVGSLGQPIVYLAGNYSSFEDNRGTGGGFTITGSLSRPAP